MRRKIFYLPFALLAFLLLNIHCKKDQNPDGAPTISFSRYYSIPYKNYQIDSLIFVELDFEDADGDFGLSIKDTMPPFRISDPYFYNVFVEYLAGKNGVYSHQVSGGNDTL